MHANDLAFLQKLRKRADHFHIGTSAEQIADVRFLLGIVDQLLDAKQKSQYLIKQIGGATEEDMADYRRSTFTSRRVCTKTAFNAAREATA